MKSKYQTRFSQTLLALCLLINCQQLWAADMFQADNYFKQQQYSQAFEQYKSAAQVGSAHAFYQLGVMYYQGLGVATDSVKALMWFSLAAEQDFNDALSIVEQLLAIAGDDERQKLQQLLDAFRQANGVVAVAQKYYPIIISSALKQKIEFSNGDSTDNAFIDSDLDNTDVTLLDFDELGIDDERSDAHAASTASQDIRRRPYSAVVDYDLEFDGSARHVRTVQHSGYIQPVMDSFTTHQFAAPIFNDNPSSFIGRAYFGVAAYDKLAITRDHYAPLYYRTMRKVLKLKNSELLHDQYQYAMALMSFKWLPRDENEVETVLLKLAEAGHPLAQYQYAMALYLKQTHLAEAIHWLNEASKNGLASAQYLLGKLLLDSPWVEKDEAKALFWFERAAQEFNAFAMIRAAELRLLASQTSLRDINKTKNLIASIPAKEQNNPELAYLQALVYVKDKPRDMQKAVSSMRYAIQSGQNLGWNVSNWQSMLDKWTSGNVTVKEL